MSISITNAKEYCKDDISKIANYNLAVRDKRVWHCHHKLGVNYTVIELKLNGLYYDRPARELVFLLPEDHTAVHKGWLTLKQIAEKYKLLSQKRKKKKRNKKKKRLVIKKNIH